MDQATENDWKAAEARQIFENGKEDFSKNPPKMYGLVYVALGLIISLPSLLIILFSFLKLELFPGFNTIFPFKVWMVLTPLAFVGMYLFFYGFFIIKGAKIMFFTRGPTGPFHY